MQDVKTYKTLGQSVEALTHRGFTAHFEWRHNSLRDANTGRTYRPDELTIVEHHRFEGPSNPDDASVVYALMAHDGTRGTVTDAFGPYANPDLGAFLKRVPMQETL